ncbi:MAG: hypothetical protein D6690_16335 [Nitrospirae bacterium]|nr:MAG: hypothetical protein D6690_16335 [Nitrospirota bacterium]
MKKYYAVRQGRRPGIYSSWEQCKAQVDRYPGAEYKAFSSLEDAKAFLAASTAPAAHLKSAPVRTKPRKSKPLGAVHIWVDGACIQEPTGKRRIGWAYVIVHNGTELHRESGQDIPVDSARHRNVAGEIMAVLKALTWCRAHGITTVTIHHDYQGLASWATGAWKATTPLTKMYAQTIQDSGVTVHWDKVAAHSGDFYNDLVDRLARNAARGKGKDEKCD